MGRKIDERCLVEYNCCGNCLTCNGETEKDKKGTYYRISGDGYISKGN